MNIGDIKYIAYLDDIKELEGKLDKELDEIIKEMEIIIDNTPDVFHDAPQSSVTENMTPNDFDYGLTLCGHGDVGNFPSINDYGVSLTLRGKNISYAQIFITRHGDIWSRRSSIIDEWNGEWYNAKGDIDKLQSDLSNMQSSLEGKVDTETIGDLSQLTTIDKTSIVHAINEVSDSTIIQKYEEPTVEDVNYKVGQLWYSEKTRNIYVLNEVDKHGATWDVFLKGGQIHPSSTYGVVIDNNNANPETRVKYIDDAVGFKPLRGNNGNTDWGSWKDTFVYEKFKPCVVKNGEVQYYLNKEDRTKKTDGSPSNLTGADGDVMVEIGKIWYRLDNHGDKQYVRISDAPQDGFKCLAHTRGNKEVDKIYVGVYLGYEQNGKLRSISGVEPAERSNNIKQFRKLAEANGDRYHQVPFTVLTLLQSIMVIILKSTDTQSALGLGLTDNIFANKTGFTDKKGLVYGASRNNQICFMGIEDFWGNAPWIIDGIKYDNGKIKIATDNFNNEAIGYEVVGDLIECKGYVKSIRGTTETGFIPKENNGSTSTYYCDYSDTYDNAFVSFGDYPDAPELWIGGFCLMTVDEGDDYMGSRLFMYGK